MNLNTPGPESDADEVHPGGLQSSGEVPNVIAFGAVDSVDGISGTGPGPDFYHHLRRTVTGDNVDLATVDFDILPDHRETLLAEPPGSKPLSRIPHRGVAQSLSSVFSSFSTFTSRKVRTLTCSRNRAGRNMSHTQASLMVTSK